MIEPLLDDSDSLTPRGFRNFYGLLPGQRYRALAPPIHHEHSGLELVSAAQVFQAGTNSPPQGKQSWLKRKMVALNIKLTIKLELRIQSGCCICLLPDSAGRFSSVCLAGPGLGESDSE